MSKCMRKKIEVNTIWVDKATNFGCLIFSLFDKFRRFSFKILVKYGMVIIGKAGINAMC